MAKYRTALGKIIDMGTLATQNERVRAVGNQKVNARGDTIDSFGRVIQPVTQKVTDAYSKTVGNKTARVNRKPEKSMSQPQKQIVDSDFSEKELNELDQFDSEAAEIEKIKSKESKRK